MQNGNGFNSKHVSETRNWLNVFSGLKEKEERGSTEKVMSNRWYCWERGKKGIKWIKNFVKVQR